MAQYWAPHVASGIQSRSEYSLLHQQRRYLLENLANEEARREHFANLFEVTKVKMSAAHSSSGKVESIKVLKKSFKNLRYKLMSSQKAEKSLAENLALLNARMNYLEQTQWRRANLEYRQSLQGGQLDALVTEMQHMGLVSPITPGFPTPPHTSGFVSPMSPMFIYPWTSDYPASLESYQLFSSTPTLQPYSSFPLGHFVSELPEANNFQPDEAFDNSDTTLQIDTDMSPLHLPLQESVPAQRAFSLPEISSTRSLSLVTSPAKEPLEGNSFGLSRKLSLANHGSSGLRLERKFQ